MNQSTQTMTRRQFMVVAGCGCAGLVIAGTGCARVGPVTAAAAAACPYSYRYDPYPGQCYRFIDSNGSGYCDFSEPVVTVVTVPTTTAATGAAPTAGAPTTTTQTDMAGTATEETRVVLCDRGCSAPGQCGRFVDSDGTGVCDLTEGIVISVSAAATATPTATTAAIAGSTTTGSATATPTATATPAATAAALVILCDRGCRYPGNCGRYTDNDGTGICDLSEGIPADQAAAYGGGGGRGRGRGG